MIPFSALETDLILNDLDMFLFPKEEISPLSVSTQVKRR